MTKSSHWEPCSGCACSNHHIPSYNFAPVASLSDNSEWTRLTRTNDLPLPSQEDALSAMITSYKQKLHHLDLEKASLHEFLLDMENLLDKKMDMLDEESARISEAIRECQGIASPIRRLPSELLGQIFLGAIEARSYTDRRRQDDRDETAYAPLSISCVSAKWRSIALSFPKLWASITIEIESYIYYSFEEDAKMERIRVHLDRSQGHPLSISIYDSIGCSADSDSNLPPHVITVLSLSSTRIRELSLHFDANFFFKISALQLSLPLLETMNLLHAIVEDVFDYDDSIHLFSSTPNLRSVKAIDIADPRRCFNIPWSQLRRYKNVHCDALSSCYGYIPQPHEHLNVLRGLQQVEECVLQISDGSQESEFEENVFPLLCPQLRVLELSSLFTFKDTIHSGFRQVSDRLTLPALTTLQVLCSPEDDEPVDTFSSIYHLLDRSKPPLTMLQFDNGPVLAEDLLNLFRITPTLEDVRLRTPNVVFTSEVLEELTVDHTSSSSKDVILPRLRHLCMCVTVCQELTRMVQSRWYMDQSCRVERLRTVKLYCLDNQSAEVLRSFVLEELEGCFREGLSFKIAYEGASCNDLHEIEEMDLPL